jgi:hypothetical protein
MDRLENGITAMSDDLTVTFGQTGAQQHEDLRDLSDSVPALHRKMAGSKRRSANSKAIPDAARRPA